MELASLRGMIFDLDGTLLDTMGVWEQVDRDFLARRGLAVPPDYVQAVSALSFSQAAQYTVQRFSLREEPAAIVAEWTQMVREAYALSVPLKPGVRECLRALRARGAKLAVAAASRRDMFIPALRRTGVCDWFDAFVTVDEVARGKGWPDVYEEAARRLGLAPPDCAVFEDLAAGVRGAGMGGFYTVAVYDAANEAAWPQLVCEADLAVCDWAELARQIG